MESSSSLFRLGLFLYHLRMNVRFLPIPYYIYTFAGIRVEVYGKCKV
uniref:Uncharacterized protein n=1 Tax=CrAss-like virus sp. ctcfK29 TaxID=2826827 RepID=A0A8S5MJX3_9CAUD|nr:MAG TPA: hypothetical protein [CrAss-like virus sp. ctcfK29]